MRSINLFPLGLPRSRFISGEFHLFEYTISRRDVFVFDVFIMLFLTNEREGMKGFLDSDIVYFYRFPQVCILFDKLQVQGVFLVCRLSLERIKKHGTGDVKAMIDYFASLRGGRCAHDEFCYILASAKHGRCVGHKFPEIRLVVQPEVDLMNHFL